MNKVKGYLLNQKKRETLKKIVDDSKIQTDEKFIFDKNLQKIAMLVNLVTVTERVVFTDKETKLFSDTVGIFSSEEELKIDDMKSYSKEVLLDQAIVTLVSSWETYFSTILEKILNDDDFVKESLKDEKFKKFLKKKRWLPDLQQIVILNMCNYNNLNFGTYLFENKRVNCQNLENVKAHALAEALRRAPQMRPDQILLVNLSGRGDKDMDNVANAKKQLGLA
jgi:hypothetical protein